MTPLGQLITDPSAACGTCGARFDDPGSCVECAVRPGDDELGRAVLGVWGGQVVGSLVDVRSLLRRITTA